jgi:hypothetical protein
MNDITTLKTAVAVFDKNGARMMSSSGAGRDVDFAVCQEHIKTAIKNGTPNAKSWVLVPMREIENEELDGGAAPIVMPWLPVNTAPKDGTMLRLQVRFSSHSTEDDEVGVTIGFNSLNNTGEDYWEIAGWDWTHDRFTAANGEVVGWLPMLGHSDVVRRLQQHIVYLEQMESMVVMEFSEEEKPIFSQGFNNHELLAPVTAKRCQEIIDLVVRYQADIDRLEEVATEYDELIRHMNTGGDFHEFMAAKAALREKASS